MKTIDATELRRMLDQKGDRTLIDTLPRRAHEQAHIPGAHGVPFDEERFVARVSGIVGTRDEPVIVYCASRQCDLSSRAGAALEAAGFSAVLDFEGGMKAWTEAGYATEP